LGLSKLTSLRIELFLVSLFYFQNGRNLASYPSKILKIFACGAGKGRILASWPSKFAKFLPAALEKVEFWLLDLPKFSKFSPAALGREVFLG